MPPPAADFVTVRDAAEDPETQSVLARLFGGPAVEFLACDRSDAAAVRGETLARQKAALSTRGDGTNV
jgi:hypothetical protein